MVLQELLAGSETLTAILNNSTSEHNLDPFPIRPWQLVCYIIITILGVVGNMLVLIVISRTDAMKQSTFGVYLGGLAVADIIVAMICLPVYITSTSTFTHHPTGVGGDILCKVVSGYNILFFFATVSVYTLVAISVERYLAICHPFSSRLGVGPERAKYVIILIWIFSILLGIPSIIGEEYSSVETASVGAHCQFSSAYTGNVAPKVAYAAVFSVQYIFPICCMVVCFVKIRTRLLQKSELPLSALPQIQHAEEKRNLARQKSIRTVLTVIISYFSCWSMNQIIYFCYNFGFIKVSWNADIVQVSVVLCFFSSCINPIIYGFRSHQFRSGFKNVLCCWKDWARESGYQRLQ